MSHSVGPLPPNSSSAPFASLSQVGEGVHNIRTSDGTEISVDVMLGSNPANSRPFVYLSGIAARQGGSAEDPFLDAIRAAGHTVIKVMLPGQGETLANDIEHSGGDSINQPPPGFVSDDDQIMPAAQAQAVIDVLDALGIRQPVDIGGISYGGAISAATAASFPDRIGKTILLAPHSYPQATNHGMRISNYEAWKEGWDGGYMGWIWVPAFDGAKDNLAKFSTPASLRGNEELYHEALFELWWGVDSYNTAADIRAMDDVYVMAIPEDGDAPPEILEPAMAGHPTDRYKLAVEHPRKHFITGLEPGYAAEWVNEKLAE
jgi:pimeloyl-ACP methyl ester carboxylesterase